MSGEGRGREEMKGHPRACAAQAHFWGLQHYSCFLEPEISRCQLCCTEWKRPNQTSSDPCSGERASHEGFLFKCKLVTNLISARGDEQAKGHSTNQHVRVSKACSSQ